MIRGASLAIVLSASAASACAQQVAPGIYGNVRLSEESGDLGGMELELTGTGAEAKVDFVFCEGWCNSVEESAIEPTDAGFTFHYTEEYTYSDGSAARARMNVEAVRIERALRVTVTSTTEPAWSFTTDLPAIEKRFGLAVASGE